MIASGRSLGESTAAKRAATHEYARVAGLPFLEPIPRAPFWIALLAWTLTFVGMWVHLVHARRP